MVVAYLHSRSLIIQSRSLKVKIMKKIFLAAAILFAVPFSSFAFSVGIDPITVPCGAQSVTVTGTADYSDGQYGPVPDANIVISRDYSWIKTISGQSSTWSATLPVYNGNVIVTAQIVSPHDGVDYQTGVLVGASKVISVPDCQTVDTKYVPSNAVIPAPSKPIINSVVPVSQDQSMVVTQADRTLILKLIKILQSLIGQ